MFGNYTYTNPILTQATNELAVKDSDRLGDIASHHVNAGVQQRWRKLDVSGRLNFVGARPTVSSNPLGEVPSYDGGEYRRRATSTSCLGSRRN